MSTNHELQNILAENSMLRKQITDASMQLSKAWSSYAKIHRENDNLRELVLDMWEFGFSKNAGANSLEEWHTKHEALAARARALRIEV